MQRGRWPRRRLYCYTKVRSYNRGLVAEGGLFKWLTDVNYKVKYGALIWSFILEL